MLSFQKFFKRFFLEGHFHHISRAVPAFFKITQSPIRAVWPPIAVRCDRTRRVSVGSRWTHFTDRCGCHESRPPTVGGRQYRSWRMRGQGCRRCEQSSTSPRACFLVEIRNSKSPNGVTESRPPIPHKLAVPARFPHERPRRASPRPPEPTERRVSQFLRRFPVARDEQRWAE